MKTKAAASMAATREARRREGLARLESWVYSNRVADVRRLIKLINEEEADRRKNGEAAHE